MLIPTATSQISYLLPLFPLNQSNLTFPLTLEHGTFTFVIPCLKLCSARYLLLNFLQVTRLLLFLMSSLTLTSLKYLALPLPCTPSTLSLLTLLYFTPRYLSLSVISNTYQLIIYLPPVECKLHESRDFGHFVHCYNPST